MRASSDRRADQKASFAFHDDTKDRDVVLSTVAASRRSLIAANGFFHLNADSGSESSIEEVHVPHRRPSRLVLVSQNVPVTVAATERDSPDSHDRRLKRVRQAMRMDRGVRQKQVERASQSIRRLASRVGPVIGEGFPEKFAVTSGLLST